MNASSTSIYTFSKQSGIPRTTVTDKVTQLGWPTDEGLSDSQVEKLIANFQNHPKLAENLKAAPALDTPPYQQNTPELGYGLTTRMAGELTPTRLDLTPVEVLEPIQFIHRDTSADREAMALAINSRLQQMEANRQAIEEAVIAEAEQRGAELALRAHQAQQAAFTTVQSGLSANAAEILGLLKKS